MESSKFQNLQIKNKMELFKYHQDVRLDLDGVSVTINTVASLVGDLKKVLCETLFNYFLSLSHLISLMK